MKTNIFNLLFAGLFISGVALTGCSKSEAINDLNNNPQKIAINNAEDPEDPDQHVGLQILNNNLGIIYALDGAVDITHQFSAYTFRFNGSEPAGQAQAWDSQALVTGSWSMQVEPGNFAISYPTNIFSELAFLNRNWTMGESSSAVVRLIAADGDEIHFAAK